MIATTAHAHAARLLTANVHDVKHLDEFGEQEAHVVARAAVTLPHPLTEIVIHQLGGAVARVAPDATAFAHRDSTHIVNVERRRRDEDRRLVHAVITKAGEKLCDRMGPVHVESVRVHFLDHVPRKALPAVGDAFDHLYAAQHLDATTDGG